MTTARLSATWAASQASNVTPPDSDAGPEPRHGPSAVEHAASRQSRSQASATLLPSKKPTRTPEARQAEILARYESGKPGERLTTTTRLLDQAG